jgi:cellulose synthase operon protein C
VAQQMVSGAGDARTRASALVYLAQIEQNRGEHDRAEHSLIEALALEGPGGAAADMFRQLIKAKGSWVGYATGLTTYIQRTKERGDDLVQAYLELAQIHGDKMGQPDKAVSNLETGLAATGGAPALAAELCRYLRLAGRLDEAAAELRRLLALDAAQPGLWRNLVQTLDAMQRPDEAVLAIAPLIVMDTASVEERQAWAQRVRRTAEAAPGSFGVDMLLAIAADHAFSTPAAVLLSAVADAVTKLYRPELEERGISRRDRISPRSQHPLRAAADRLAAILGIEYELYVHPRTEPSASLEMTEPISVVVAEHVSSMPEPHQVFLLASVMIPAAARYFPAEKLSPRELEMLLAAAARVAVPGYNAGFDSEEIESYTQRLKKHIPRKWRRSVETAGADYAASGGLDVAAWQQALRQTTLRAALLLSDDLVDAIDVLRDSEQIQGQRGVGLVRGSALAADLLRFWGSREAAEVRRVTGLLPTSWPADRGEA